MVYAILLVAISAVILLLASSTTVHAALDEAEPPDQYEDWDTAYDLKPSDLGAPFDVRREGGGDHDYISIGLLNLGEIVTIRLDNYGNPSSVVECWVHDPGRFPIADHNYDGSGHRNATMSFIAIRTGPYFLHFGQGFGTTVISVNITVTTGSWVGDGNDRPEEAEEVSATKVVNGSFGQPDDPSDFYKLPLDPSPSLKTFLSFSLSGSGWTKAQWEMYDSDGILRNNLTYGTDTMATGSGTDTFDERMMDPGTVYLRLWCIKGSGDYRLYINIVTYANDGDDSVDGAGVIVDGQTVNGTIHTKYDKTDHYSVDLKEGDTLQLGMDVDDDADLFVLNSGGYRVASSDNWNDESENITYSLPPGGNGTYYVLVTLSTELDPFPLRVITYRLEVITNLPPELDADYARTYSSWPMLEDRVDEGILLTDLFSDPEGGPLSFIVVPGHNTSYIDATVTGAMRLRLEPAENVSGFVEAVTVECIDVAGKTTRFVIEVGVIPVNDAPVVGHPSLGPPPDVLEMDEDTTGGPWDLLFWFWDSDNVASELIFSFETDIELSAEMDDLDRLVVTVAIPDWHGRSNITIRARDPDGLGALIRMPIFVRPVNDAPRLRVDDVTVVVEGGVVATLDLAYKFMDVEGDDLTFAATSDYDLTFSIDGNMITVFGLLPHQGEKVIVHVTAMDPQGTKSDPLMITLEVGEMEDPHAISSHVAEYTMLWGMGRFFTDLTVEDPDPGIYTYDVILLAGDVNYTYNLKQNGSEWLWEVQRPYWAPEWGSPEGDVVVTMLVYDEWYSASVSWVVHVRAANAPPEIESFGPDKDGPYTVGDEVTFSPRITDPEGDPMEFGWYLDRDLVGSNQTLTVTLTESGLQELELVVWDGFNQSRASYEFMVVAEEEEPDRPIMVVVLILVGSAAAVGVVFYIFSRGRGPD
jgi:hypothetical protein